MVPTLALVAMIFGAVPTAEASFSLAREMISEARAMAGTATIETPVSFLTLALTLMLAQAFCGADGAEFCGAASIPSRPETLALLPSRAAAAALANAVTRPGTQEFLIAHQTYPHTLVGRLGRLRRTLQFFARPLHDGTCRERRVEIKWIIPS